MPLVNGSQHSPRRHPDFEVITRMLSDDDKSKLKNRLNRIAGQIDGLQRMIDADEYCVDILMQISAATGALNKVGAIVLENHVKTCVRDAFEAGDRSRDEKLEELVAVFQKYSRK